MMWNRRGIVVALALAAVVATAVPALAQVGDDGGTTPPTFEEQRAAALERLGDRAGALAERRALLEEAAGLLAGVTDDVTAATTPEELRAAIETARPGFEDLRDRSKQLAYSRLVAHVADDVAKFTARADRLAAAIEAASTRGVDTTAAAAELDAAYVDISAAAGMLAGLPADAGDEVDTLLPLARDAHGTVHAGQAHLRTAASLLREAVGGVRPPAGESVAL